MDLAPQDQAERNGVVEQPHAEKGAPGGGVGRETHARGAAHDVQRERGDGDAPQHDGEGRQLPDRHGIEEERSAPQVRENEQEKPIGEGETRDRGRLHEIEPSGNEMQAPPVSCGILYGDKMDPSTSLSSAPKSKSRAELLKALGPGLITGAADDDPSGIATYSQVGAQFGYSMSWTMIFSYPLMVVVQGISAGIGAVTGQGIAQNLRRHYPRPVISVAVLLLLIANVINLGADLAAMGAALQLLIGGPDQLYALVFAVLCAGLEIFVTYERYVTVLKWLTLSLFAYVAVVLAANVPWGEALHGMFVPQIAFDRDSAMALVAILGTTISPYLFFWQAGE